MKRFVETIFADQRNPVSHAFYLRLFAVPDQSAKNGEIMYLENLALYGTSWVVLQRYFYVRMYYTKYTILTKGEVENSIYSYHDLIYNGRKYLGKCLYTVESPNNGHGGDEHFVHCSEVVPSSEVLPLSAIISLVCESQCI